MAKGRKKPNKEISEGFASRLKIFVKDREMASFGAKIGASGEMISQYLEGAIPRADILLKISKEVNKSMEWLLTGEENKNKISDWPNDIKEACEIVHKIMTSDNKIAKDALHTNLVAFEDHDSLRIDKKRMDQIEAEIAFLKELYNRKTESGT